MVGLIDKGGDIGGRMRLLLADGERRSIWWTTMKNLTERIHSNRPVMKGGERRIIRGGW